MRFAVITLLLLTLLYFSRFIPSKEQHAARKRLNKLPVGTLTLQAQGSNNTFVDAAGTIWLRRPYIMSLAHEPSKKYVFETYDLSTPTSSEAIADKSLFDKGRQVFTEGSFNYNSPFQNPISHVFSDMLPTFIYS